MIKNTNKPSMNIVLLEPKNRENLATTIRSGQNFGVNTVFVIGGFVKDLRFNS